jgi:hypothetical protein
MEIDEIQHIINNAYPLIKKYYGKSSKSKYNDYPNIELHEDIYARLSGDPEQRGEHSESSEAQYEHNTNKIYIYYPNMVNEEHVIRSIIHEYTHYLQDSELFSKYKELYDYDEDPTEIEAHKNEENWQMFSAK